MNRASADWMMMENATGYAGIKCWAERQQVSGQLEGSICVVRSNMIGGFPPRLAD
jgi:hypothetical protein